MERLKGPGDVGGGYLLGWLFFLGKVSSEIYDCLSAAQVTAFWRGFPVECRIFDMYPDFHSFTHDEQVQSCLEFLLLVKLSLSL